MRLKTANRMGWRPAAVALATIAMLGAARIRAAEPEFPPDLRISGGIIVHLGCGRGERTPALRFSERCTVHALDPDPDNIAATRRRLSAAGLHGPITAEVRTGSRLPYADNVVNLLLADDPGAVPDEEILRVLVPNGRAAIRRGETWRTLVKPRPDSIDDWTHHLHDAGNNAVARDEGVAPPRGLQWIAAPLWLRSHETPSGVQAMVSAGGRLFYLFDEGLIGIVDERIPDRWSLICRDAFNGRLLWKRPLPEWGWREWAEDRFKDKDWTALRAARTVVPPENQRRLVAADDTVAITLGYRAPVSILDAASGEVRATVEGTDPASEILIDGGIGIAHVRAETDEAARRRGAPPAGASVLVGFDPGTGGVLWRTEAGSVRPLFTALHEGMVVLLANNRLRGFHARSGAAAWDTPCSMKGVRTLVAAAGTVLLRAPKQLAAFDIAEGAPLWQKEIPEGRGAEAQDLFVTDGLAWPGMCSIDDDLRSAGKGDGVLAVGLDVRTGEERRRLTVRDLRSPEHHHRCYRNKATSRFMISGLEGAEFLDLRESGHSQNNWLRGACKEGIMPANGLLYVPADQCFCEPGAKLLGFCALRGPEADPPAVVPDAERLVRGPAYAAPAGEDPPEAIDSWPTFRHDPARSGASPVSLPATPARTWTARIGGDLTAPVAARGLVLTACKETFTVHALDAKTGETRWTHAAAACVDSPPTVWGNRVLFGSRDGYVTCLRADDGEVAWRFLAAPADRRIGAFDRLESIWPVSGSVLVRDGIAYVAAGRSTYLDGGIRLYGLDPVSGEIKARGLLEGPHPDGTGERDVSFYVEGANADVLVSEGGFIYMRQKKLTPDLREVPVTILSSKGEADVGLHVFATSGLLDDSGYNRAFRMYSKRWPGFQLANQAPKAGQILAVGPEATYAVKVFYRRNVHSPMFFPGKEGNLLFADRNDTEPQIVGEEGARPPLPWLPQSDYSYARGDRMVALDSPAFGLDKMVGYTRADPPLWTRWLPVRVRALVKTADTVFAAGPPDAFDSEDPYRHFDGKGPGVLTAVAAGTGSVAGTTPLPAPPVFDGLIATRDGLFLALQDGSICCFR